MQMAVCAAWGFCAPRRLPRTALVTAPRSPGSAPSARSMETRESVEFAPAHTHSAPPQSRSAGPGPSRKGASRVAHAARGEPRTESATRSPPRAAPEKGGSSARGWGDATSAANRVALEAAWKTRSK